MDSNAKPDLGAAYEAGVRFAILRGAWGTFKDPVVARDRAALKAARIQFGAYLYLRHPTKETTVAEPEEQARMLIAAVGALEPGDLPPTLDIEYGGSGRAGTTLSVPQAIDWAVRAHDTLRQVYETVMVYTSARVWRDDLLDAPDPSGTLGKDPLWIKTPYYWVARRQWDTTKSRLITDLPRPWRETNNEAWIQQIQGDAVGLPGFNKTVDINLFHSMRLGETSGRVIWVQKRVGAKPDGDFGPLTDAAVRQFQRHNGLTVDGIVGPRTFGHLCS